MGVRRPRKVGFRRMSASRLSGGVKKARVAGTGLRIGRRIGGKRSI